MTTLTEDSNASVDPIPTADDAVHPTLVDESSATKLNQTEKKTNKRDAKLTSDSKSVVVSEALIISDKTTTHKKPKHAHDHERMPDAWSGGRANETKTNDDQGKSIEQVQPKEAMIGVTVAKTDPSETNVLDASLTTDTEGFIQVDKPQKKKKHKPTKEPSTVGNPIALKSALHAGENIVCLLLEEAMST